jgi:hypothetical protein
MSAVPEMSAPPRVGELVADTGDVAMLAQFSQGLQGAGFAAASVVDSHTIGMRFDELAHRIGGYRQVVRADDGYASSNDAVGPSAVLV